MNFLTALILGIVQGLTEFLPVSSSAHLVLVQEKFLTGFSQPGILFDVILHLGTVGAVLFYFRKEFLKLKLNFLILLFLGTIPAALVGVFFRDSIIPLFSDVKLVGLTLLITGFLNLMTDKFQAKKQEISAFDSLMVGVAQAIAIIPGISRSGSTIFAASSRGISRSQAAFFSFTLSIPAILGASLLELINSGTNGLVNLDFYLVGFVASFISGFVSIGLVLKFLKEKHFSFFAYYCFVIGFLALII